jgi:hypothetical protein
MTKNEALQQIVLVRCAGESGRVRRYERSSSRTAIREVAPAAQSSSTHPL